MAENPICWEQSASKCFIETRNAGSNRRCLRKPELLGVVGGESVFEKQSVTLAAARTINPCNHVTPYGTGLAGNLFTLVWSYPK